MVWLKNTGALWHKSIKAGLNQLESILLRCICIYTYIRHFIQTYCHCYCSIQTLGNRLVNTHCYLLWVNCHVCRCMYIYIYAHPSHADLSACTPANVAWLLGRCIPCLGIARWHHHGEIKMTRDYTQASPPADTLGWDGRLLIFGFWFMDYDCLILIYGWRFLVSGFCNSGFRFMDSGLWFQDADFLDYDFWNMVSGLWFPDSGLWIMI